MKMGNGEARQICKVFSIQGFVKVLANIALHFFNSLLMNQLVQYFSSHINHYILFYPGGASPIVSRSDTNSASRHF